MDVQNGGHGSPERRRGNMSLKKENVRITVAGTGYVGLSMATLLSQHHEVQAVDLVKEKVEMINARKSPIQDAEIERFFAEKRRMEKPPTGMRIS